MSDQIISAIISAIAVIIAALIAARGSGRGKDRVIERTRTEYVPYTVVLEKEGWIGGLAHYIRKLSGLIIMIICFAIFGGIGAWAGSLYLKDIGWTIGFMIGLLACYMIVRRIK